jgi:hypothetical protein
MKFALKKKDLPSVILDRVLHEWTSKAWLSYVICLCVSNNALSLVLDNALESYKSCQTAHQASIPFDSIHVMIPKQNAVLLM